MSASVAWLLEQIAADEAAATDNGALAGDHWSALEPEPGRVSCDVVGAGRGVVVTALGWEATHIARWDPARVLAECEAKREIVTQWLAMDSSSSDPPEAYQLADFVLQQIAQPYADRPGFPEEWRT